MILCSERDAPLSVSGDPNGVIDGVFADKGDKELELLPSDCKDMQSALRGWGCSGGLAAKCSRTCAKPAPFLAILTSLARAWFGGAIPYFGKRTSSICIRNFRVRNDNHARATIFSTFTVFQDRLLSSASLFRCKMPRLGYVTSAAGSRSGEGRSGSAV